MMGFVGGILNGRAAFGLSDAELLPTLLDIRTVQRAIEAERLELLAEMLVRDMPMQQGYRAPWVWADTIFGIGKSAAQRLVATAQALPKLPDLAEAVAELLVSPDQAFVIADAAQRIGGDDIRREAVRLLIEQTPVLTLQELKTCASVIEETVDPDGVEERLRKQIQRDERHAWDSRGLTLANDGTGRVRISGYTTPECAAIIQSALDPLCNPGRRDPVSHVDTNPELGADPVGGAVISNGERVPWVLQDSRRPAQRRHDALVEVFGFALAAGDLPENGGEKAQLVATMHYDPVEKKVRSGQLDTGARISPEALRRIACDAGVIPAILSGSSEPLDVGRERRLINGALRRALVLRDRGCSFPGCSKPPKWAHGHHIRHWSDGGETALHNSALLCWHHHVLVHHAGWTIVLATDGIPEFIAPMWLDPDQTPRRNTFHRRA